MRAPTQSHAIEGPWAPYVPSPEAPWDVRRVVHLHRRAGFAATWDELQRDLKDGPEPSIDRLLSGRSRLQGVPDDFESLSTALADSTRYDANRLEAWWIYRMLFGPDPLGERLTLMWHNHFATSLDKVRDPKVMRRQNELLRRYARAPFAELLGAVVRDPAMLVWLDASANKKGHANENLARELMELFTLGIGHYTEADVKEAARALTGWTVRDGAFAEDPAEHDDGPKTLFGRTGRWKGDDLVQMLIENPATADRLAWRLAKHFLGEGNADRASLQSLAEGLRANDLDIGWAVGTILRSRAFFDDTNAGARVVGPVELVVALPRALEQLDPPPSTLLLADWSARLGQELFHPPNVGGWSEGRGWITHQGLIGRANFAAELVRGRLHGRVRPVDPLTLAARHGRRSEGIRPTLDFFAELLLGRPLGDAWGDRIEAALGARPPANEETARRGLALLLASPEAQLA